MPSISFKATNPNRQLQELSIMRDSVVVSTHPTDDDDDERLVRHINRATLEWVSFIEPLDDRIVWIYAARKQDEVVMGDIIFQEREKDTPLTGFDPDGMAWYDVVMASTKPIKTLWKARCATYLLFLQLDRITDEERLRVLRKDYRELMQLPF